MYNKNVRRLLNTCFQRKTRSILRVFRVFQTSRVLIENGNSKTGIVKKKFFFFRLSCPNSNTYEMSKTYEAEFRVGAFRTNAFLNGDQCAPAECIAHNGFIVVIIANTFERPTRNGNAKTENPFWDFRRPYRKIFCYTRVRACHTLRSVRNLKILS